MGSPAAVARADGIPEAISRIVADAIVGSPFGRWLGAELASQDVDRVSLRLPFRPDRITIADVVHGGAITSLIDIAATAACWSSPEIAPGSRGTTIGMSVSFLRAARSADLVADAVVVQRGRSISTCEVDVADSSGNLVAKALVSYKLSG